MKKKTTKGQETAEQVKMESKIEHLYDGILKVVSHPMVYDFVDNIMKFTERNIKALRIEMDDIDIVVVNKKYSERKLIQQGSGLPIAVLEEICQLKKKQ